MLRAVLGLVAASVIFAGPASANLITFDDLPDPAQCCLDFPIPADYAGLSWSDDWRGLDGSDIGTSGYQNGTISPKNVAFTAFAQDGRISSNQNFTLESLYVTAAWRDNLQLGISGYRNGAIVDGIVVALQVTPTFLDLDWKNIDALYFSSDGGTPHIWLPGGGSIPGTQYVIDNLDLHFTGPPAHVPEPMSLAVLASGLLGFCLLRRRG